MWTTGVSRLLAVTRTTLAVLPSTCSAFCTSAIRGARNKEGEPSDKPSKEEIEAMGLPITDSVAAFDEFKYGEKIGPGDTWIEREWWVEPVRRTFWASWFHKRDIIKRRVCCEYAPYKLRLKVMNRNNILPVAFREEIAQKMRALPVKAHHRRIPNSCQFTGAKRGKNTFFRAHRRKFRELADHADLSGVIRAKW